jgi:hypothetical protein
MAGSEGTCEASLRQLILVACDFLAEVSSSCQKHQRQFEPFVESQVKTILYEFLPEGIRSHKDKNPELKATMVVGPLPARHCNGVAKRRPRRTNWPMLFFRPSTPRWEQEGKRWKLESIALLSRWRSLLPGRCMTRLGTASPGRLNEP